MRSRKDGRRKRFKRQGGCLVRGVPPVCAGGVCLDRAETGHEPGVQHPFSRFCRRKGGVPAAGKAAQKCVRRSGGAERALPYAWPDQGGRPRRRPTVPPHGSCSVRSSALSRALRAGADGHCPCDRPAGGEALSASAARPASVLRSVMSGEVIPAVRILLHTTCIYLIGMSDFFIGLTATPHFIPYRQRNPNRYA